LKPLPTQTDKDHQNPDKPSPIVSANIAFNVAALKNFMNFFPLEKRFGLTHHLEADGISYLSAPAGSYNSIFTPEARKQMARPAYLCKDMVKLTGAACIPTIISGRVITPSLANRLLDKKAADLIGLGRPLRADMNWVTKAAGRGGKITNYINCNGCLKRVVLEQGFSCRRWPGLLQEKTDLEHNLLTRNYKGLWVTADKNDLELYQTSLPLLLPDSQHLPTPISPTILFLEKSKDNPFSNTVKSNFLKWSKTTLDVLGFPDGKVPHVDKIVKESYHEAVRTEIRRGGYGVIIIGRNREQPWRERLLYKERHKIMALMGSSKHQSEILVPVDLSKTTPLIMMFLRRTYIDKTGFRLNFIHVLSGSKAPVKQRWKRLIEICGLNGNLPLQTISSRGDVAEALLETIHTGRYGTIIMGKRGLSGIKRWLLGSVSTGVLCGLTDHSLFLVD
jgi:universal stress protein family protein